jgi:hypothetical protein
MHHVKLSEVKVKESINEQTKVQIRNEELQVNAPFRAVNNKA